MIFRRTFAWIVGVVIVTLAAASPCQASAPVQAEIDGLRRAYLNLVAGNHDYKGHRVRALKHVEEAARSVGLNISGDGKARSPQKNSDTDLAAAKSALQDVLQMANSNGQPQLSNALNAAIQEINIALSIR